MAEYNLICYIVEPLGKDLEFVATMESWEGMNLTFFPAKYLGQRVREFVIETDPNPTFNVTNKQFTLDERYEVGKFPKRSLSPQEERDLIDALNGK